MKNGTATLEDGLVVSYKSKYTLTIWSQDCTLDIYPNELKIHAHTKTFPKLERNENANLIHEWINQQRYIHTIEYCLAIKRNDLSSYKKIWSKLKCIILSERSQCERLYTMWFQLYNVLEKGKKDSKESSGCQGFGRREGGMNTWSTGKF